MGDYLATLINFVGKTGQWKIPVTECYLSFFWESLSVGGFRAGALSK
ncbi:hypothetical protein VRK_01820 [Vibrio sp. MEBiC08052]|nr:hypothetical protein VRK_01820 [Vibrio sp. MEBiC08052]